MLKRDKRTNENEKVPFKKAQSIDQHQIDNLHRQFSSIFHEDDDNETNESDNEVINNVFRIFTILCVSICVLICICI